MLASQSNNTIILSLFKIREKRLYFPPKVHKDLDKWPVPNKMPPFRPIVSDCGSESYRVSEYIDSF